MGLPPSEVNLMTVNQFEIARREADNQAKGAMA